MAIDPNTVDAVIVPELDPAELLMANLFAHSTASGKLNRATINDLAVFLAPYVASIGASGFVSVDDTVLPNPTSLDSGFSLVGAGTYTQTTGGNVTTTTDLSILSWDGSTWTIGTPITINLSAYQQKSISKIDYQNILSLEMDIPVPSDKSSISFTTGNLNPAGFYFESSTLVSVGERLKKINIKAEIDGDVRIGFISVTGGVASVVFSTTYTVESGINDIDVELLQIPVGVYDVAFYVAVTSVTSGVLKYLAVTDGDGNVTANLSGGAITPTSSLFPYWIVKKYTLDEYPETKKLLSNVSGMTGESTSTIVPEDKSALVLNGNGLTTIWLGTDEAWFGSSRPLDSISFKSRVTTNDIRISFVEITGSTANIIYTSPVIDVATTGTITIPLSSLSGVPSDINTAYPRLQVFMTNEVFTGSSSFGFKQVTAGLGEKYYSITKSTGALATNPQSTSVVLLGYWINVLEIVYPEIVQQVKDLQAGIRTVSTFSDLVDALSESDEIKLDGVEFTFDSTINITSAKIIRGNKNTVIKLGTGVTKAFYINEASGAILSDFVIDGGATQLDTIGTTILPDPIDIETLVGIGTKTGIHVYHSQNVELRNITCQNLDAYGFHIQNVGDDGAGTYRFKEGIKTPGCSAINCYIAYRFSDGAQYSRLSDLKSLHSICGISITSGNVTVVNGQFDNNRIGIHVGAGSNNAHGSFVGGTANHNALRGVYVANITNGHVFSGVNIFDGHIEVYNSIGVLFSGCLIASEITATLNTDQGMQIVGCIWRSDGGYNTGVINKSGAGKLFLDVNRFTSGKTDSSINGVL